MEDSKSNRLWSWWPLQTPKYKNKINFWSKLLDLKFFCEKWNVQLRVLLVQLIPISKADVSEVLIHLGSGWLTLVLIVNTCVSILLFYLSFSSPDHVKE